MSTDRDAGENLAWRVIAVGLRAYAHRCKPPAMRKPPRTVKQLFQVYIVDLAHRRQFISIYKLGMAA
jgi:hypothetical protein